MLPGEEYAREKGYSIYSHSGNKEHATYVKYFSSGDDTIAIFATFNSRNKTIILERTIGMINCKLDFSYPHRLFDKFETQLAKLQEG